MQQAKNKNTAGVIILALSGLGLVLSLYLAYLYSSKASAAFCTAGSGCDTVRESSYAIILGVPVALVGVIGYSLIFALSIASIKGKSLWFLLYLVALAGFAFSAYLTYIELFVIHAICFYCLISAILITAILLILLLKKPPRSPAYSSLKLITLSAMVLGVVLLGSFFIQSRELKGRSSTFQVGLAKHLGDMGATMYGSFQCPHCTTQKLLFGKDAFKYVNYVECHPRGENANTALCYAKGIHNYPTWEINGQFVMGAKSLQELARLSDYKPDNAEKGPSK
jgi:uncharacterized membrane protein/glutaredoxin